jgi:hypothetical protein
MLLFREVLSGWRKTGAIFFILIWGLTLILLILFLVSFHATGSFGDTTLFIGSCTQSSRNVLILRLFINIVSTAVLTSSNFFLQLLTSPTRDDIDNAHRRRRWLDIGIPSFRNLRCASWSKLILWLLIAVTSLPFHLLFNSSVYDTDARTEIIVVLANEQILQGGNYSLPGTGVDSLSGYGDSNIFSTVDNSEQFSREVDYIAKSAPEWQRLDGPQCYEAYSGASPVSNRRHLVIILSSGNNNTGWNLSGMSELWNPINDIGNTIWEAANKSTPQEQPYTTAGTTNTWCEDYFIDPYLDLTPADRQSGSDWEFVWPTGDDGYGYSGYMTARYCLSEQIEGFCRTQVSNLLIFVVFLCCLGKSIFCTVAMLYLWHSRPLSTVGDAVDSFICIPDPTTEGMCTFGWRDFARNKRWTVSPRLWSSRKRRCSKAVPLSEWLTVYILSM